MTAMTKAISPRSRKVRILATLGPASSTPEMIEKLFEAGADAFRINMSHGDQASKVPVFEAIRGLEKKYGRPTTILADLQGPKLRVGKFAEGKVMLAPARNSPRPRQDAGRCHPRRAAAPRDLRARTRARGCCSTTASWCCA
jgi:pyruvate kinase